MINVTTTTKVDVGAACSRGIAHAARALGDLVGMTRQSVEDAVAPMASLDDVSRFSEGEPMVVIGFSIDGGLPGRLVSLLPEKAANQIAERLVGRGQCDVNDLDSAFFGALSETGNIVASAFLNGVAESVGQACWPSVPDVQVSKSIDDLPAILAGLGVANDAAGAYLLRADLQNGMDLRFAVFVEPANA